MYGILLNEMYSINMISVIIPLYNKENCIRKTIDSIINQKYYHNFEIIVVDDGSTDCSCIVVESYTDKRVKLFRKKNGGPSSARNFGVKHATGEWIIFIDADDYLLPDSLSHFEYLFVNNPGYLCYTANFYTETNGVRKINSYLMRTGNCKEPFKKLLTKQFTCRTGAAMFHREVLIKNQFNESIRRCEDMELTIRLIRSYQFYTSAKPVMVYNQDSREASFGQKVVSWDFLANLKSSEGTFWERVYFYKNFLNASIKYPDIVKRQYNRNDFEKKRYKLALIEIKIYLKINSFIDLLVRYGINQRYKKIQESA